MNKQSPSADFLLLLICSQSSLYAAISAMMGGIDGAQDVLQETNVVLLEKMADFDANRPFLPWAMTFARFQVMAWRKRQARDRLVLDDALFAAVADRLSHEQASPSARLDALEKCLNKLPAESRILVDARYIRGEAVQDIARQLGRTVNVVSVSLFRIRKALLDCVQTTLATEVVG